MNDKHVFPSFEHYESRWNFIKSIVYSYIFKKITARSQNLFLRAGDIISVHPQIKGQHETELTSFIGAVSKQGFSDFLIDIGANIGLTSCQNGNLFKEVHMFEPNPLCCNILEVNSAISLPANKFIIHKFGLGIENKFATLTIPRKNWGGAFIRDAENSYDSSTLAKKDGFESIDQNNYFQVNIELRNSKDELGKIFGSLSEKGLKNGFIKIDIEGYEPVVIKGIAESIPDDMSVYIAFESWNPEADLHGIRDLFGKRATIGILDRRPIKQGWLKIFDIIEIMLSNRPSAKIKFIDNYKENFVGDVIIKIC